MRQKDETPCADCGLPRYEHDLNGAAYGTCGQWVPPVATTDQEMSLVDRLRLGGPNAMEAADEAADEIERLAEELVAAHGQIATIVVREVQPLQEENKRLERERDIFAEALAEIKATHEGKSDQPIGAILSGCIEEIAQLKRECTLRLAMSN